VWLNDVITLMCISYTSCKYDILTPDTDPDLKIILIQFRNFVPNVMLLSQSVHKLYIFELNSCTICLPICQAAWCAIGSQHANHYSRDFSEHAQG
jgi:hypothetical protein